VLRVFALTLALASPAAGFHSSIKPLPSSLKKELKAGGFWHKGCPVPLSGLRLLTVTHRGFDKHNHTGQLIVNRSAASGLRDVFHQLYRLHFPIHHMRISDYYGPKSGRPKDDDVTESFECREAAASPCTGNGTTGSFSMHAYGLAVDVNTVENPYVGCGMTHDPRGKRYLNRSKHRRGMVTPRVVSAFRSIGWGWGGAWSGNTKDYQHFSSSGH
jgi:D-alanyl-D-alanine carboxypeptidase